LTDNTLPASILELSVSKSRRRKPVMRSARPRPPVLKRARRRRRNLRSRRLSKMPRRKRKRKLLHGRKPRRPKPLPPLLQRRPAELLVTPVKPTNRHPLSYRIHSTYYILLSNISDAHNKPEEVMY